MKNILVLLADFANGMFAVLLAGYFTNTELVWWHFVIGIILAMSPDIDAIPEIFSRGKVAASPEHESDHRSLLHYPILFLGLGVAMFFLWPFWGALFIFATMLHFVNDIYGTGWGIKIFWPITNLQYKILGRRANLLKRILTERGEWNVLSESEKKLRLIVSWNQSELPQYIKMYGLDEWIEPYYLRLNWICVIEYSLFIIAVSLSVYTLLY